MRNYSKQETGERLHDSTPLGATEFPPDMQMGGENKQRGQRDNEISREKKKKKKNRQNTS